MANACAFVRWLGWPRPKGGGCAGVVRGPCGAAGGVGPVPVGLEGVRGPLQEGPRRRGEVRPRPAGQDADPGPRGGAVAGRGLLGAAAAAHRGLRHVPREGPEGHRAAAGGAPPGRDAEAQEETRGAAHAELHPARFPAERRAPAPGGRDRPGRGVVPRTARRALLGACAPGQHRALVRLVRRPRPDRAVAADRSGLVHPAHTIMDCGSCGARTRHALPLSQRTCTCTCTCTCTLCKAVSPRDKNSARVMLLRAAPAPAGAEGVRPPGAPLQEAA